MTTLAANRFSFIPKGDRQSGFVPFTFKHEPGRRKRCFLAPDNRQIFLCTHRETNKSSQTQMFSASPWILLGLLWSSVCRPFEWWAQHCDWFLCCCDLPSREILICQLEQGFGTPLPHLFIWRQCCNTEAAPVRGTCWRSTSKSLLIHWGRGKGLRQFKFSGLQQRKEVFAAWYSTRLHFNRQFLSFVVLCQV